MVQNFTMLTMISTSVALKLQTWRSRYVDSVDGIKIILTGQDFSFETSVVFGKNSSCDSGLRTSVDGTFQ